MFKFVLIISLISFSFVNAGDVLSKEMAKFIKQCNQNLVKGYGMKGLKFPKKMQLAMCPLVTKSCCQLEDQMTMYANWVHSKEKYSVELRFKELKVTFGKTLKLVQDTMKLAKSINKKLSCKLLSNCKLLAKKILMFEMDQTGNEIMKAFSKMDKYMKTVYSSLYCSVCDHKNHLLFDITDNAVYYSQNFCRSTVEHMLIPALYMNVHFKYVMSAVTRFVTSCDFKGMFTRDVPIPPQYLFPIDEKMEKSLLECRNSRNKPDWFVECEPLCSAVNLSEFSSMLVPEIEPLVAYNKFLEAKLKGINNEARLKVISAAGGTKKGKVQKKDKKKKKKTKKVRILEAAKKDAKKDGKKKATKGKKKKKKTRKIYFTAKTTFISKKTTYEYNTNGLDLYEIGKNSLINDAMFNQVKNAVALKKMKKKGMAGGLFHREIKKSGLFQFDAIKTALCGLITLALFMKKE
jgi:hypothetical protein